MNLSPRTTNPWEAVTKKCDLIDRRPEALNLTDPKTILELLDQIAAAQRKGMIGKSLSERCRAITAEAARKGLIHSASPTRTDNASTPQEGTQAHPRACHPL